jgi:hypothetical protein
MKNISDQSIDRFTAGYRLPDMVWKKVPEKINGIKRSVKKETGCHFLISGIFSNICYRIFFKSYGNQHFF